MDKRQYKNSTDQISLLGFGCMRFPESNFLTKKINKKKAIEMIDYAYKNGVNYFDTAYIYHLGKSENFIGEALSKYPRNTFYLADKLPTWFLRSADDVEKYFEKQLKKCGVEYFDFYLVHSLNEKNYKRMLKYEVYPKLKKFQEAGKIKYLGFSFHDKPELLDEITQKFEWDFAQIQLNYLDWELQNAKKQYEILRDKNIPIVIMEPVRGGALVSLCAEAVSILKEANPNASTASWAIRYTASFPEVITVLSGMSNMEQVMDNVNTLTDFKPLTNEERQTLNKCLNAYNKVATIHCTACRYCMDCPFGLDIPSIFKLYNSYKDGMDKAVFIKEYDKFKKSALACSSCGKCQEHCPQHIKIPDQMKRISKEVEELR